MMRLFKAAFASDAKSKRKTRNNPRRHSARRIWQVEPLEDRRLLAAGTLDATFDDDGRVPTDFPSLDGSRHDIGRGVAIQQSDGMIVVVGNSSDPLGGGNEVGLVRYNTDGSRDISFGDNGRHRDSFPNFVEITSIALQTDGKILVAGSSGTASDFFVARYNADGSPDLSFDGDGWLTTDFGQGTGWAQDFATSVTVQANGKILVAGYSHQGTTGEDFALARYNTDGRRDTTFGVDGKVTTDFASTSDRAFAIAVQLDGGIDGDIIVAGYRNDQGSITGYDFAVARYSSSGTLDLNFGADGNGKRTTNFDSSENYATSVALQGDGKIVVAGYSLQGSRSYDFALARYNSDGSDDTTFGIGGKVTTDFAGSYEAGTSVALQSNGKIVVGGYSFQGSNGVDFALARYTSSGALDNSFDGDGKVTTDFGGSRNEAHSVALQADGKIVAVGFSYQDGISDFAVARYLGDNAALVGAEFQVNTITTDSQSFPSVAMDEAGNFVVTWTSLGQDGSSYGVYGQRYAADGSTLGGEFRVNTTTTESQDFPSVAMDEAGNFVVTWTSLGQDG
ncbi:MAG: hypothetical protein WD894_15320, partial [Pirellulales bacterium]